MLFLRVLSTFTLRHCSSLSSTALATLRAAGRPPAPRDPAIANSIHDIRDAEQRRHAHRDARSPGVQTHEYGIVEYPSRSSQRSRPRLATCFRPDGQVRWAAQPARKAESVEAPCHCSRGEVVLTLSRYIPCALQVLPPGRLPGGEFLPLQP